MKKVIRKNVRVRYIGDNPYTKDNWGDSIQTVMHKRGNFAVGMFPVRYMNGDIHCISYSVPIAELEIVK